MRVLRVAALFVCLTAPFAASAQQVPPLAGIAHVALRVHSLTDSIAFYESLGFEQAFDLRRDNVPYESFIKINDHQFIELYPATPANPDLGFLHLCFEGDDLQAVHDDYTSHGLKPTNVRKAGAGNLLFTMPGPLEPNGPGGKAIPQNIEYTQYMPGSLHSNDFGQHLGKDRIAETLIGVAINFVDPTAATAFYFNDLSFKPLPGEPQTLHLPGTSGEEIKILNAKQPPWLILETSNLARATRRLSHEHVKVEKFEEAVVFADPDGNQIVIRQH